MYFITLIAPHSPTNAPPFPTNPVVETTRGRPRIRQCGRLFSLARESIEKLSGTLVLNKKARCVILTCEYVLHDRQARALGDPKDWSATAVLRESSAQCGNTKLQSLVCLVTGEVNSVSLRLSTGRPSGLLE